MIPPQEFPSVQALVPVSVSGSPPGPEWTVDGKAVDADELRDAHLSWYRRHPDAVEEGLRRHADLIGTLTGAAA